MLKNNSISQRAWFRSHSKSQRSKFNWTFETVNIIFHSGKLIRFTIYNYPISIESQVIRHLNESDHYSWHFTTSHKDGGSNWSVNIFNVQNFERRLLNDWPFYSFIFNHQWIDVITWLEIWPMPKHLQLQLFEKMKRKKNIAVNHSR